MTVREMIEILEALAKVHGDDLPIGKWGDESLEFLEKEDVEFCRKGEFFGEIPQDMIML